MIKMQTSARYIRCRSCASKRFVATVSAKADCIVDENGVIQQISPIDIEEAATAELWICAGCGGEAYSIENTKNVGGN